MLELRKFSRDIEYYNPVTSSLCFQRILHNLSVTFYRGEVVCLVGPNGAGKSTLFETLTSPFAEYEGGVLYENCLLNTQNLRQKFLMGCAYLGHEPGLFFNMSVEENLDFFYEISLLSAHKKPKNYIRQRDAFLEDANLLSLRKRRVSTLSRGQKQKLGLVRCFQSEASIFFLDEPQNALDKEGLTFLSKSLQILKDKNRICLISSHNPDFFSKQKLVKRFLFLNKGRLVRHI